MLRGLDVLGASDGPALVIQLRNLGEVVRKKGGAIGAAAYAAAPQAIAVKAYEEMKKKLTEGFAQQGVDADVRVVYSAPSGGASPRRDLLTGAVLGVGVVGVGYGIFRVVRKLFFR